MQRCPKCGFREKYDWPSTLWGLAFLIMYAVFFRTIPPRDSGRLLVLAAFAALALFVVGVLWKGQRSKRNEMEYKRLHPGPNERVKEHVRPNPANS